MTGRIYSIYPWKVIKVAWLKYSTESHYLTGIETVPEDLMPCPQITQTHAQLGRALKPTSYLITSATT